MESHPVVWGLDIGHTSIKAVKLARSGDTCTVLGYAIEPIASGDEIDRDEAVVSALQSLALREELGATPVVTSLSGRQIFARTINIPIINEKKLDKMVELEARQQIPGNFDEVRWGFHKSPSTDGGSFDVALFAVRNEIVDDLISKTASAGLNLVGISVTSLAVYNYVQYDQDFENDETVMVLDVGAENTDLVVYKGDSLWMRNLGISGNDITRAFQKKFRVSFEEAEQLKCQVGESRQADKIFKVIEGSIGELVSDVQRSLGFYKSSNREAEFECMVVSGNTFRLPNLTQYIADRLGYAIITLVEMERIKVDPGLDRDHFLEDLQSLGTAVGLALQGVGAAKADVNLLPSSLRLQGILKTKRWAAIAVLLILPIMFLITYMVEQSRLEANWSLVTEVRDGMQRNKKAEQSSLKIIEQIPEVSTDARRYADYGAHVGTLRAVELGLFDVAEQLVTSDLEVGNGGQDFKNGGSPQLAPVYLDSISIPNLEAEGVDVFQPLAERRRVVVVYRVPVEANVQDINARLLQMLSDLRVSPTMWRVANPEAGDDEVPAETDLPRLFANVKSATVSTSDDYYYFMDPLAKNEFGDPAPESERKQRRPVKMQVFTFNCELGPIAGLEAQGG